MKIEIVSEEPRVVYVEDLLDAPARAGLISAARQRLAAATVYGANGRKMESAAFRIGESAFLPPGHLACRRLVDALVGFAGVERDRIEDVQIARYQPGGYYVLHHDSWQTAALIAKEEASGGQRTHSLLAYLAAPAEGGRTTFPHLEERDEVQFLPVPGAAVLWANLDAAGKADRRLMHKAEAVTRGEKWVAVAWARQRPWRSAS